MENVQKFITENIQNDWWLGRSAKCIDAYLRIFHTHYKENWVQRYYQTLEASERDDIIDKLMSVTDLSDSCSGNYEYTKLRQFIYWAITDIHDRKMAMADAKLKDRLTELERERANIEKQLAEAREKL